MNRLTIGKIVSVGLVDAGDNPGATIAIYKRSSKMKQGADSAPDQETPMDRPADVPDEAWATIEKALSDYAEQVDVLNAQVVDLTPDDPDPTPEPVQKELEDLRKSLADERTKRVTAEYVQKAAPLNLGDDAAAHLMALGEGAPDSADWLFEQLGSLTAQVKESGLFKTVGSVDGGDAADKIAAIAKQLQKDSPELSDAAARNLARQGNPDLKAAERAERSN